MIDENIMENRIPIEEVFSGKNKKVELAGWVKNTRALGKIKFLVLRDISGEIQVTAVEKETDKKIFEMIDKIPRESVISIEGEVKESKQAPNGKEQQIPDQNFHHSCRP